MKSIVVVSDLHCGSIFGMLPAGFQSSAGHQVGLNSGQSYLWDCWQDFVDRVPQEPDAIVVNGDVIDGRQQAQRGTELSLPLLEDQSEAAYQTLNQLGRGKKTKIYFTQGTEYHDSKAGREVEVVAKASGATPYKAVGSGRYSREVLDLNVDGVRLNFLHGVGVASGLYKSTGIDREGAFASLATHEKIDCIVRSHAHHYVQTEYPRRHNIITPCWELQTRFMRKNSAFRMLPDIGGLVLWVDGQAKKDGEDPIRVQKVMYRLPAVEVNHL